MFKKNFHILLLLTVIGLFLFQIFLQFKLAKLDGQIIDEAPHISAGYTYLAKGDYRFNPEHPPLVKYTAGLGLLAAKPHVPNSDHAWGAAGHFYIDAYGPASNYGQEMLYTSGNDANDVLFAARIGPVVLTLILGLLILFTAIYFWGWWAGLVAYALYTLDPLIAGHGHLVTTDVGASIGYLTTVIGLWYLITKQNYKSAIIFGILFGIAQLMKFTLLMLIPLVIGTVIYLIRKNKTDRKANNRIFVLAITAMVVTFITIWAGYGFHRSTLPFDTGFSDAGQAISQPSNGALRQMYTFPKLFSWIPLPYDYIRGAAMVLNHTGGGHPSYLLGQHSTTGWKYYFPLLIIVKTPIPELILIISALVILIRKKLLKGFAAFAALAAAWYMVVAIISPANLGLRHIMPVYPLLFLITGYWVSISGKKIKYLATALIVILGLLMAYAYPFYLSYFNQLAGGSYNGYKIATDSNLDWGGDLKYIKSYVDNHPSTSYYVMYNWDSEEALDYYDIARRPTDQIGSDSNGMLIIGASTLQSPNWMWVKEHKLVDQITPGVLVYNLDEQK